MVNFYSYFGGNTIGAQSSILGRSLLFEIENGHIFCGKKTALNVLRTTVCSKVQRSAGIEESGEEREAEALLEPNRICAGGGLPESVPLLSPRLLRTLPPLILLFFSYSAFATDSGLLLQFHCCSRLKKPGFRVSSL